MQISERSKLFIAAFEDTEASNGESSRFLLLFFFFLSKIKDFLKSKRSKYKYERISNLVSKDERRLNDAINTLFAMYFLFSSSDVVSMRG